MKVIGGAIQVTQIIFDENSEKETCAYFVSCPPFGPSAQSDRASPVSGASRYQKNGRIYSLC